MLLSFLHSLQSNWAGAKVSQMLVQVGHALHEFTFCRCVLQWGESCRVRLRVSELLYLFFSFLFSFIDQASREGQPKREREMLAALHGICRARISSRHLPGTSLYIVPCPLDLICVSLSPPPILATVFKIVNCFKWCIYRYKNKYLHLFIYIYYLSIAI